MLVPGINSVAPQNENEIPTRANSCAVVVLFQPRGDLVSRLRRVQRQVARLWVVSNDRGLGERLDGLDSERFEHVQNEENLGLAAALNIGLQRCLKRGFAWCLLLDQDTLVDEDLLSGLAEAYLNCPERETIGLLAPNYRSPGGNRVAYRSTVAWQYVATVVTSGSLVPLAVVKRLGGMRESFFIEGIDIEFSLRIRAAGMRLLATGRPLMTHGAGDAGERRVFGRTVLVANHPPWRCFLQYRNLTWILLRYGWRESHWTGITLVAIVKRTILICLLERQRPAKLWAMLRGIGAGIGQQRGNGEIRLRG